MQARTSTWRVNSRKIRTMYNTCCEPVEISRYLITEKGFKDACLQELSLGKKFLVNPDMARGTHIL